MTLAPIEQVFVVSFIFFAFVLFSREDRIFCLAVASGCIPPPTHTHTLFSLAGTVSQFTFRL